MEAFRPNSQQNRVQRRDLAGSGFLRLLRVLRTVVLQDSVGLRRLFADHPIWEADVFASKAYGGIPEVSSGYVLAPPSSAITRHPIPTTAHTKKRHPENREPMANTKGKRRGRWICIGAMLRLSTVNPGDLVTLKLHHGYRVPGIKNKKLSIQRVGRLSLLEKRTIPKDHRVEKTGRQQEWESALQFRRATSLVVFYNLMIHGSKSRIEASGLAAVALGSSKARYHGGRSIRKCI
ncbi:hypothetical protein V8E54_000714 [Elaphomyces granulatus]